MVEVKIKSVIPIYAIGVFWLLYSFIFPIYRISNILIAAVLSGIVYFICSKLIPDKVVLEPEIFVVDKTGVKETDEVILKGKEYVDQLSDLSRNISEPQMKVHIEELLLTSKKIFNYIAKNPENARQLRTFMNYYFPTTIKLLEDYRAISKENVQGKNISATMEKIENVMGTIENAFHTQLDDLYQNKALDVYADISVLESLLASEGLLGGTEKWPS